MFDSPLTLIALGLPPIVAGVFIVLYAIKRDPLSQPSIVAAIPLVSSSIAILLGQSAIVLLAAFQEIAQQRTSGVKAVTAAMLRAQQPLGWGLLDVAICVVGVLLCTVVLRYSRDEEAPLMRAFVSLPALIATAVALVTLILLVYLQYSTVDLVMMIVDNHRYRDLASQYGSVNPAYLASRISSHLVILTFTSVVEFVALVVVGVIDLFWQQKQNPRQAFATILTVGALIGCGASALTEFGFVDYVQHIR